MSHRFGSVFRGSYADRMRQMQRNRTRMAVASRQTPHRTLFLSLGLITSHRSSYTFKATTRTFTSRATDPSPSRLYARNSRLAGSPCHRPSSSFWRTAATRRQLVSLLSKMLIPLEVTEPTARLGNPRHARRRSSTCPKPMAAEERRNYHTTITAEIRVAFSGCIASHAAGLI